MPAPESLSDHLTDIATHRSRLRGRERKKSSRRWVQGTGRGRDLLCARDLLFPLQTCMRGVLLCCLFSVVLKCSGVGEQVLVLRLEL